MSLMGLSKVDINGTCYIHSTITKNYMACNPPYPSLFEAFFWIIIVIALTMITRKLWNKVKEVRKQKLMEKYADKGSE